ncbi:restriction endonuclease [Aliarcobacter thereius]|uniref:restriction endonuclease n=1 Tax=Aliarcobacter thereius TaxID=544718 RepID=UPI0008262B0F|nr:restriction endonuclease [Aliarcobacter thereius]OCL90917.1 hypothetical protein AAX25_01085 [Aliarcobacter thereius]
MFDGDIEVTKEIIKTKNQIFVIKNINNISYDKEAISFVGPGVLFLVSSLFIYIVISKFIAICISIIAVAMFFMKFTKYHIIINGDRRNSIHTLDEKIFSKTKNKIEEALENYQNNGENKKEYSKTDENINKQSTTKETTIKRDRNYFTNLKNENQEKPQRTNSNYFTNLKNNIKQGLEKDIVEINKFKEKKQDTNKETNQNQKYKQYTEEEKKSYGQRMKELREKGKEYEKYVAGHFKIDGYEIFLNGIKNGVRDKGIDIICTKDNELILIQCKNWKADTKYKINHEKLKAFVGSCTEYVNQNKLFDKNIKLKFITSNYILDKSGEHFINESKTLQYQVIEY